MNSSSGAARCMSRPILRNRPSRSSVPQGNHESKFQYLVGAKPVLPFSIRSRQRLSADWEDRISGKWYLTGMLKTLGSMIPILAAACCLLTAQATQTSPVPAKQTVSESSAPESSAPSATETEEASPKPQPAIAKRSIAPDKLPEQAWAMLLSACENSSVVERAKAVRTLGLLPNDPSARKLAEKALDDEKPEVRLSAAAALGDMHSRSSIPKLRKTLTDNDVSVALAAAHSLLSLHDDSAYEVYYEVLTQQRKASKGLIASQIATLRDPKKIALLGFEEGIGFVPFASIGWSAIKEIRKDDTSPVRAAAVRELTGDRDSATTKALLDATQDNSWLVRAAALEALARRGNPRSLSTVELGLTDEKDVVRFTAAAATVRLDKIQRSKHRKGWTSTSAR
jgi:HEAT repeat protein